jgi:fucose 4-O-acetylase-like acetyltransferase
LLYSCRMSGESSIAGRDVTARVGARLEWVDAAKGLGIIAVVIAHVWTRGPVRDFIYAFHMPLFFLLSGYMFRAKPMGDFVRRLASGMAVPYVAFLLLLALFDWGFESARGHHPIFRDGWDATQRLILGGSELRGPFTIFWFAPCLFFARILQNGVAQYWPQARDWRWALLAGVCLAIGIVGGALTDFSPLGLLSVPVALALLWMGALWRSVDRDGWVIIIAALVAFAVVIAGPVPLNMKVGDYGVPVLSLAGAVALSLCLSWTARRIAFAPLCALGRMSLVIMYIHVGVIHYGSPYAPKWLLFCAAMLVPVLLDRLFAKNATSRKLFLGQSQ